MESYIFKPFILIVSLILSSSIKCLVDTENKLDYLSKRSSYESCKRQLKPFDLIPILSFLFKRGRCSYCSAKIPFDIFLYEFFTASIIILYFVFEDNFVFVTLLHAYVLILLIYISIEDIKYLQILDELFFLLLLLNIILLINNFYFFDIFNFLFLILLFHILYYLSKGGLGYGDIKVYCVLAINLNIFEGIYLLAFTFVYAGFFALSLLILKKVKKGTKIPLVPFITLSYLTIILIREGLLW